MTDHNNNQTESFTQKDLMHHLLNATQHAATREELSDVKNDLIANSDKKSEEVNGRFKQIDRKFEQIDKRFEILEAKMDKRFEILEAKIDAQAKKHDKLLWLIMSAVVAVFFKTQILNLFA